MNVIGSLYWFESLTIESAFYGSWNIFNRKLYFEIYSFTDSYLEPSETFQVELIAKIVKLFH